MEINLVNRDPKLRAESRLGIKVDKINVFKVTQLITLTDAYQFHRINCISPIKEFSYELRCHREKCFWSSNFKHYRITWSDGSDPSLRISDFFRSTFADKIQSASSMFREQMSLFSSYFSKCLHS